MNDNLISVPKQAPVIDEFAQEEDKKKAYRIFAQSALLGGVMTAVMYLLTQLQF